MNHLSMNNLTVETEDAFASLLDLAANNDVQGCKKFIDREPSSIHEAGFWYGRQKGSKHMVLQQRTPLMVASTYGSLDVLKLILSLPETDVNQSCGSDTTTALHCAASGGSANAIDVVKLLLAGGADPNLVDADGLRPVDIVVVSPNFQETSSSLKKLLMTDASFADHNLRVSASSPPSLSPSPGNRSPSSTSDSTSSPKNAKFEDTPVSYTPEKKEYPIDPSLPDIKNSIYSTDEFRMYSFKVRPCSRAYSHDWTECPFVHPGENARRRDPRKFHYSCVPCPEFRKGSCRRGDMCEYAHGVFECWLHPAQYRTRLCKDGTSCNRRVCFFAHTQEELRPLYHSTGSAVPSPGSSPANAMEFLLPGSPSSVSVMSPSPFTPPMSPSGSGMGWQQPNVPTLHLPGSNFQSSRLRSSFNARDIHYDDMNFLSDFDGEQQLLLNDLSRLSHPSGSTNSFRSARSKTTLTPSNLDDLFSAESSSPRYCDQMTNTVFSPTHKSAMLNQFQQQPMNTNFFPKNVDHPLLQATFNASSPGRMSPRNVDPISPMSARNSFLAQHQFRSLSSRDLGSSAADENWSKWTSFTAKPDWATTSEELARLKRASSFDHRNNGEEPDLSWVQTLVKESPQDAKEAAPPDAPNTAGVGESSSDGPGLNSQIDQNDPSSLGAWLEQMQLDQLVAQ